MNSRYQNTQTKLDDRGKRVKAPVIYPPIPKQPDDIYLRVSTSERLDFIAYKYYGNSNYYWIIAEANGIGKGSMQVPVGMQLRIPTNITKIMSDYESLNK